MFSIIRVRENLRLTEKKKVLFFIYQMGAGGAARTLLNIINNIDRLKFEPILVTLDFNGNYEDKVKSDITFIKLNTKRLRKAIIPLAKVIREEKVDLVFSTIPNYNTIAILANFFSFTRAKNIVREADNLGGNTITNLKLIGYGWLYKLSSQVIALSEGVKENLVKRYKIKPEHVKVIYNPIDLENIRQSIENGSVKKEHFSLFKDDRKTIITAGRLVKQKDQKTLIKAFEKVNQTVNADLVILGEGELDNELKKLAKDLSIHDRVHFIGFQHNPYIFFEKADLFVLTSIHEGFGHVIAEALATGTPVISTNCQSGPKEVLDDGKYGLLTEVGNVEELAGKMLKILSMNEEELLQIQEKGYERAADFDARNIVKQYEDTFMEVIEGINRRG